MPLSSVMHPMLAWGSGDHVFIHCPVVFEPLVVLVQGVWSIFSPFYLRNLVTRVGEENQSFMGVHTIG